MKHDDRFSMIAGGAAFLATATVFALTHLGGSVSVDRNPAPEPTRERITVAEAPRLEPPAETVLADEVIAPEPDFVTAVNRSEAASGADAASVVPDSFTGPAIAVDEVLRLLALSGPDVPGTADVLVRRDRDGRMVIAAGTRRGYASLVDRFEALDPSRVHVPRALRGELTRAIDELIATPRVEVEPAMVSDGVAWTFADPELATLDRAQRQLLLMGRDNADVVRAKLEELRRGLAVDGARRASSDGPSRADSATVRAIP